MNRFIEITDSNGYKRLVNTNFITDIVGNRIYLGCGNAEEQISIDCKENYEDIKMLIWR